MLQENKFIKHLSIEGNFFISSQNCLQFMPVALSDQRSSEVSVIAWLYTRQMVYPAGCTELVRTGLPAN